MKSLSFSAPMIRAILAGAKTMTRRPVKPQPAWEAHGGGWYPPARDIGGGFTEHPLRARHYANAAHVTKGFAADFCPYGAPGDVLYVREAWRAPIGWNDRSGSDLPLNRSGDRAIPGVSLHYDADGPAPDWAGRYRHARFMPQWAARISLAVESVRVERVQAISDADIKAEGVTPEAVRELWAGATRKERESAGWNKRHFFPAWASDKHGRYTPRQLWESGWTLIYGRESWLLSQWVWVIGFRRIGGPR